MIRPEMEEALCTYIRKRFRLHNAHVLEIEAVFDHIHIVHTLPRDKSISKVMMDIKSMSSYYLKRKFEVASRFDWQDGYSCFSVDYRRPERVCEYVRNQKRHHYGENYGIAIRKTFEQEYEAIIISLGVEYERKYLFPTPPAA